MINERLFALQTFYLLSLYIKRESLLEFEHFCACLETFKVVFSS